MSKQNSDYRREADMVARETGWTIRRFALIFVSTVFFLGIVGFGLNSLGLFGETIVQREVFEQSYQRAASEEARFNTLSAELEAVNMRLDTGSLTDVQRDDLEAQAAALRLQINQMEGK